MNITQLESFKLSDAIKFHDMLNTKLFVNNKPRPEIKKQLLIIAKDFISELGVKDLAIEDITISGSNAAYTYTDHSDLDLHILVDFKKLSNDEIYQELFNAKKTIYNDNHNIKVRGVPVELYVQNSNQPVISLGEYSLLKDKWVRIPAKRKANLDQTIAKQKYNKLYDLIQIALKSKNINKIEELLKTMRRYRQAGLDKGGEFSPENLSYKALRSQGWLTKLYKLRDDLHSKRLSIESMYETLDYQQGDCPIFAIALHRLSKLPLMALIEYDEEIGKTVLIHSYVKFTDGRKYPNIDSNGEGSTEWYLEQFPNNGDAEEVEISEKDLLKLGYGKNKCPTLQQVLPDAKEVLQDIEGLNNIVYEQLDVKTMSPEQLAKHHGVSITQILAQLDNGIKVELEHTSDKKVAKEIALDHLKEDPNYYSKLLKANLEENIVQEGLSPIVYHYTRVNSAKKILSQGEFQLSSVLGSVEEQYAPKGHPYFLSTTRSRQGGYHDTIGADAVLFVLDGTWYSRHHKAGPVDYWQNRDPVKSHHRKHEAEDRIFSKDPTMSIKGVKEIHIYVSPDAEPKTKAWARQNLILAKRLGTPSYFYTDPKAWKNLDTRKTGNVSILKGIDNTKGYVSRHKGYLLPWVELIKATDKKQLSAKANEIRYGLLFKKYYVNDMARGLANELSNARKPNSGPDREHAVNIIKHMRTNKLNTIMDLVNSLAEKWKSLEQVAEGDGEINHLKEDPNYTKLLKAHDASGYIPSKNYNWNFKKCTLSESKLREYFYQKAEEDWENYGIRKVFHMVDNLAKLERIDESRVSPEIKELLDFQNSILRYDMRSKIKPTVGNKISIIQVRPHTAEKIIELRGHLNSKIIENIVYDNEHIAWLEFTDGTTFPDKSLYDMGHGNDFEKLVTLMFPSRNDAEGAISFIYLQKPEGWEMGRASLGESPASSRDALFFKRNRGKVEEASGYIPSESEKNDPRYKSALTVDVRPNTMRKDAKKFGNKISRAGAPPTARSDGKI